MKKKIDLIKEILLEYSYEDLLFSIFVSDIFLLNIATFFKHNFLYLCFLNEKQDKFSNINRINSFQDFKDFIEKIYKLIPDIFTEDAPPAMDWGEIKYFHEKKIYKIFYSTSVSYTYDHIEFFKMVYSPFKNLETDPIKDLEYSLEIQDLIISNLEINKEISKEIKVNHLETPDEVFWNDAINLYKNLNLKNIFPEEFLERYSFNHNKDKLLDLTKSRFDNFLDKTFIGDPFLPFLFIKNKGNYYPIIPRQSINIIFNYWYKKFPKLQLDFKPKKEFYYSKFSLNLIEYITDRFFIEDYLDFVSIFEENKEKQDKYIIPLIIRDEDKLIFVFLVNPFNKIKDAMKELSVIDNRISKIKRNFEDNKLYFLLNRKKEVIEIQNINLDFTFLVVLPQLFTSREEYKLPPFFKGKVLFLDQFLGIFDELDNISELNDFLEFKTKNNNMFSFLTDNLDKFAAFKYSEGVLIEGAVNPSFVSLEPQLGDELRYETLKDFWSIYPNIDYFDNPRSFELKKHDNDSIHFYAKGFLNHSIYFKINKKGIFVTSAFENMNREQIELVDVLIESVDDSFLIFKNIIEKHNYFKKNSNLVITFFPLSLVNKDIKLKHLKHLSCDDKIWNSEIIPVNITFDGFRLVFNDQLLIEKLLKTKDRSFEIDFFIDILLHLNNIVPDINIKEIIEEICKHKSQKLRNGIFEVEKKVSFPTHKSPILPNSKHYKEARKFIAESALSIGLVQGEYILNDAKEKINLLKVMLINKINDLVKNYSFKESIPYLIENIDSLANENELRKINIKNSLQNETEYSPEEEMANISIKYISYHKEYRYLIEKFIQFEHNGLKKINKTNLQEILAFVNWLISFQEASDGLHYSVTNGKIFIDNNFLVEIKYDDFILENHKLFEEENQKISLGISGNENDNLTSDDVNKYLEKLDKAFLLDFGFGLRFMVNVLLILSDWSIESRLNEEKSCYSASYQEIEKVCTELIIGITTDEIRKIIDFLTLKKEDILKLVDSNTDCPDIPIWEHNKRHMKYVLKPLILIDNLYYWGAYSTKSTSNIWVSNIATCNLPYNITSKNISEVIKIEKKNLEDKLVLKTLEIFKRFTKYAKKEFELFKLEPKYFYEKNIGDYDVFAFLPDKNIIFNVECKYLLPAYTLKDAERLKEKIFGIKKDSHIKHIKIRYDCLESNWADILNKLGWSFDIKSPPKIVNIYVSRKIYWCMWVPPKNLNINFVQIDMLEDFIKNIE